MSVLRARSGRARMTWVSGLALVVALALAGCSLGGGSVDGGDGGQGLSSLPWCAQPQIGFIDSTSSAQAPITNWDQVKDKLGFTPYLPASLPKGACLDLVGGTIHDPMLGGHLSVTWVLPQGGPISFSEAPKRGGALGAPQCTQSAQGSDATTLCIGAVGDASVTIASHLSKDQITGYFNQLQPATDWEPAPAN
jgi:hypothetical protein